MKICLGCKITQPIENFYLHAGMKDGRLNFCKSCTCARVKKHRQINIEAVREYDRKRGELEKRKQAVKKYQQENKEICNQIKAAWRKANKNKVNAQGKAKRAFLKGLIQKKPCEVCKSEKTEKHHPNYDEPLNIIWLCKKHHAELHCKIRDQNRKGNKK